MHPSPLADTGERSEGVTATSIGVADDPPNIITTTSTRPDDSDPRKLLDSNPTLNPKQHITLIILIISLYTLTGSINDNSYCSTTCCYCWTKW